ncbi:FliM/FliN family flagellar motor switch protein [Stutzerimonas balearica]|uniref:FliM/FliN family flagellar motor switch protein n=2 Tax=Stutzerimonas TaxID=2901164 RepID=UPI0037870253
MSGQSKVHHGVPPQSLTVLKPHKLGRHHHRVPQLIKETTHKNPRLIGDYFLRHYRINIELADLLVGELGQRTPDCIYRCALGKVGFAIDRELLTEALECYYGGISAPRQETPPISSSEQRMRDRLGHDVADIFFRSLLGGESFGALERYQNDYEERVWEYVAEYQYLSHLSGRRSSIFIFLDAQLVDELTDRLAGPSTRRLGGNPLDQVKHLPVRLDCVIAATQMPLAQALELAPGDVLLLRPLDRYEVRINGEKLYRGAIFEEDGALFLTSLESVNAQ